MPRSDQLRSLLARVAATGDARDRLNALAQLRRELDAAETELAADALRAGFTWSQIGEALGISKQAAHRRHSHDVARLDQAAQTEHAGRNVLVGTAARQAVRIARREAAAMGATRVGTEHLLLGLLQCGDEPTGRLLKRLGVTLDRAREVVQPTLEVKLPAAGGMASERRAVVSPLARRVLEHALADIQHRSSDTLGALDLLRAVLRHDNGGAARTLAMLDVDAERVREEIGRLDAVIVPPP